MRNLKKILALVLALVMSLSLMATASAADTTAASPTLYKTATDVLVGLTVVKGDLEDPTNYRTNEPIIRAEAAALIYRVHTGDVNDTLAGVHDNTPFDDLGPVSTWATGYISYAQNAQIVKGKTANSFDPLANITGYETLAMTLRAMGYGKNGEFEGDNWRNNTASWAQHIGLLAGVTAADQARMDEPATRGLVFQIMFNAMLLEEVGFSYVTPDLYASLGTTLGQRNFGLETVTGVIMANEWANLLTDKVLASGQTKMKVTSVQDTGATVKVDDVIDLNHVTEDDPAAALDAVGLTYNAYIANGSSSTSKTTLTLEKGANNVAFNEGKSINYPIEGALNSKRNEGYESIQDLAGSIDIKGAEYFVNYREAMADQATSDWQVRYAIAKASVAADDDWAAYIADVGANKVDGHSRTSRNIQVNWDINDDETVDEKDTIDCWVVSIRIGKIINSIDLDIMYDIFDYADRIGDTNDEAAILPTDTAAIGEVYLGTSSLTDQSDIKTWEEFKEELDFGGDGTFNAVEMGNSLRVIDNNMDGKAEYVLAIAYTQDKAVDTRKDIVEFNTVRMNDSKYTDNTLYNPDDISTSDIGTVVNYAVLDNKLYIWKAPVVANTKIDKKNFQEITVTATVDGETYGQSDIVIATGMMDDIMQTSDSENYNLYLDQFNYIRSYELADGNKYALLTEMYVTGDYAWNYIKSENFIAEAKLGDADIDEYRVTNMNGNGAAFLNAANNSAWTSRYAYKQTRYNFLQPAIAHLDELYTGYTLFRGQSNDTYKNVDNTWGKREVSYMQTATQAGAAGRTYGGTYGVFDFGDTAIRAYYADAPGTTDPQYYHNFSYTNVALYNEGDGEKEIALSTAAKLSTNNRGEQYFYGPDATNTDPYGEKRTAADWAAFNAVWNAENSGTRPTTVAGITAANGYYPVYAMDYVQMDVNALGTVKAGSRHFVIDDNYDTYYKTNSNGYVDATLDTLFYVVTPDGATLYTGYNELPTIDGDKVRAAYAVARNTNADSNGVDYWVADVIVFEVIETEDAYESISLMYYNPYETSKSVRYVRSLNNEWHNLQPDYTDEAKMTVVPVRSNGGSASWGDNTWSGSDYGFYELYDTELTEAGSLNAGNVKKITTDWNDHGIYAGTVYRINGLLNSSGYIDVDKAGRGLVYPNPKDSNYVYVGMTTKDNGFDVPVYRITREYGMNSADTLTLSETSWNEVELGDPIIWVLDHAKKNVSFVVDLGQPPVRGVLADPDYYIPSWLLGIYNEIIDEQTDEPEVAVTAKDLIDAAKAALVDGTFSALDKALNDLTDALTSGDIAFTGDQLAEVGNVGDVANAADDAGLIANLKAALAPFEAQELSDRKDAAKALTAAAVADLAGYATATGAQTTLDGIIGACTTLDQINAIYDAENDTLKTDSSDVEAFNAAIALANNQKAAVDAANDLVPPELKNNSTVNTKLEALVNAIKATSTQTGLDAIYDATDDEFESGTEYDALMAAIEAAAANEEIDKSVENVPGVPAGTADATDKMAYNLAYDAMEIDLTAEGDTTTISFSLSELMNELGDPNANQKRAIQTMLATDQQGKKHLAVGVSFKAPEDANRVLVNRGEANEYGTNVLNGYFVRWIIIADGAPNAETGGFDFTSIVDSKDIEITMEFFSCTGDDWSWETGHAIGGAITRNIVIDVQP